MGDAVAAQQRKCMAAGPRPAACVESVVMTGRKYVTGTRNELVRYLYRTNGPKFIPAPRLGSWIHHVGSMLGRAPALLANLDRYCP